MLPLKSEVYLMGLATRIKTRPRKGVTTKQMANANHEEAVNSSFDVQHLKLSLTHYDSK
jgi:hypothetical protein